MSKPLRPLEDAEEWFHELAATNSGTPLELVNESMGDDEWSQVYQSLLFGLTHGACELPPHPLAAFDPRFEVLGHLFDLPSPNQTERALYLLGVQIGRTRRGIGAIPALLCDYRWAMSSLERTVILLLAAALHPPVAVDAGTFLGGSAEGLARLCERVVTIDRDPGRAVNVADLPNVEFVAGNVADQIGPVLDRSPETSLIVLDAEHSREGVAEEVAVVLGKRPPALRAVVVHDAGNPDCRAGLLSVDWASSPWVQSVSLGFSPPDERENGLWGGLALIWLTNQHIDVPPTIDLSAAFA